MDYTYSLTILFFRPFNQFHHFTYTLWMCFSVFRGVLHKYTFSLHNHSGQIWGWGWKTAPLEQLVCHCPAQGHGFDRKGHTAAVAETCDFTATVSLTTRRWWSMRWSKGAANLFHVIWTLILVIFAFFCFMDALDTQPQPTAQTVARPAAASLTLWVNFKTRTGQTDWQCCIRGLGILSLWCDETQHRDSLSQHTKDRC